MFPEPWELTVIKILNCGKSSFKSAEEIFSYTKLFILGVGGGEGGGGGGGGGWVGGKGGGGGAKLACVKFPRDRSVNESIIYFTCIAQYDNIMVTVKFVTYA